MNQKKLCNRATVEENLSCQVCRSKCVVYKMAVAIQRDLHSAYSLFSGFWLYADISEPRSKLNPILTLDYLFITQVLSR